MIELWKSVPDFFAYEISNYGRVRRAVAGRGNAKAGMVKKPAYNRGGYAYTNLSQAGKLHNFRIHNLVLTVFGGPPPAKVGYMPWHWQCNHKDGDKTNNHISNLEWVTMLQNRKHAVAHDLTQHGEGHHMAKLNENNVREIRQRLAAGEHPKEIVISYPVSITTIYDIKRRKSWQRV